MFGNTFKCSKQAADACSRTVDSEDSSCMYCEFHPSTAGSHLHRTLAMDEAWLVALVRKTVKCLSSQSGDGELHREGAQPGGAGLKSRHVHPNDLVAFDCCCRIGGALLEVLDDSQDLGLQNRYVAEAARGEAPRGAGPDTSQDMSGLAPLTRVPPPQSYSGDHPRSMAGAPQHGLRPSTSKRRTKASCLKKKVFFACIRTCMHAYCVL